MELNVDLSIRLKVCVDIIVSKNTPSITDIRYFNSVQDIVFSFVKCLKSVVVIYVSSLRVAYPKYFNMMNIFSESIPSVISYSSYSIASVNC
jgi:hypothetical protein